MKPNRDGWVTGPLANLPPCPPFPAFTDFERTALDQIAAIFGPNQTAFRAQIAASRVTDRINTVVGFYTRVAVDKSACQPMEIHGKAATFEVDGIAHGMGVILWAKEGYLDTIEGYTFEHDPLKGIDLSDLRFSKLVELG